MRSTGRSPCANCQLLQAQLDAARLQITQLQEQLARSRKDSSTSSKPPSSDIVKPQTPAPADAPSRSIGGQPGHAKHEREPFRPEQVTQSFEHVLDACPGCGSALQRNGPLAQVVQQVDITQPPLTIEQHTCPEYWCDTCQRCVRAALPLHVQKGAWSGLS